MPWLVYVSYGQMKCLWINTYYILINFNKMIYPISNKYFSATLTHIACKPIPEVLFKFCQYILH